MGFRHRCGELETDPQWALHKVAYIISSNFGTVPRFSMVGKIQEKVFGHLIY